MQLLEPILLMPFIFKNLICGEVFTVIYFYKLSNDIATSRRSLLLQMVHIKNTGLSLHRPTKKTKKSSLFSQTQLYSICSTLCGQTLCLYSVLTNRIENYNFRCNSLFGCSPPNIYYLFGDHMPNKHYLFGGGSLNN